ncbi:hypothetical protein L1987_14313 [Smallanthus sonchifolius]|uniref:Uncharacterized protein n=1 Tax=Smallanthus sonchifolius TaxID=185202 RepID=A0ACB9J3B2_9ASTR|nr:hypothetical protein L1987_14313 [Smallanthus sonchifolius]
MALECNSMVLPLYNLIRPYVPKPSNLSNLARAIRVSASLTDGDGRRRIRPSRAALTQLDEHQLFLFLQEKYEPVYAKWTTERCAICRWDEDYDVNKIIICNSSIALREVLTGCLSITRCFLRRFGGRLLQGFMGQLLEQTTKIIRSYSAYYARQLWKPRGC